MDIFVYSDESGVFDKNHNRYFVFGGVIMLGSEQLDDWNRKYAALETEIRKNNNYEEDFELKASNLPNKIKTKLFRGLNKCFKFGVVIKQENVLPQIWDDKKSKQRFLDYVYKIAIKRAFQKLIAENKLAIEDVRNIYFFIDEHTTATNGKYELEESLEKEFKIGTYNSNFTIFYKPLFPAMNKVKVQYCDSSAKRMRLVRAADIVANRLYFCAESGNMSKLKSISNLNWIELP